MLSPYALTIGFFLGAVVGIVVGIVVRPRIWPRRRPRLPLSVASASPELITQLRAAVSEQYPGIRRCAYATVSVFEHNSPASTVHLYPARGPHLGAIQLDSSRPNTPRGTGGPDSGRDEPPMRRHGDPPRRPLIEPSGPQSALPGPSRPRR